MALFVVPKALNNFIYNYIVLSGHEGGFLGHVVLSLSKEGEERLRRLAHSNGGGKKGSLSKTVEEAVELLEKMEKQRKAIEGIKKMSERGLNWGIGKFNREDAYE